MNQYGKARNPAIRGGGKRKNRDARKDERRDRAMARAAEAADRTDADRLAALVARGHGHCAEAQELRGRL